MELLSLAATNPASEFQRVNFSVATGEPGFRFIF